MPDKRPKLPRSSSSLSHVKAPPSMAAPRSIAEANAMAQSSSKVKAPPSMAAPRSIAEANSRAQSSSSGRPTAPPSGAPGSVMPSRLDRVPGSFMSSKLDGVPGSTMPSKLDRASSSSTPKIKAPPSMVAPRSIAEANAMNEASSKITAPQSIRAPPSKAQSFMPSRLDSSPLSNMASQLDQALPSEPGRSNMPSRLDNTASRVVSPPSTISAPPSFITPPSTSFPSTAGRSVIPSASARPIPPTARSTLTTQHDHQMAARQTRIEALTREERIKQEEWARTQLTMNANKCPLGFDWARRDELKGYRCQPGGMDGTHLITDELLAEGRARFFAIGMLGWDKNGNEVICGPFSSNVEFEDWMRGFLLSLSHQQRNEYMDYKELKTRMLMNRILDSRGVGVGMGGGIGGHQPKHMHLHQYQHRQHHHHHHHHHHQNRRGHPRFYYDGDDGY